MDCTVFLIKLMFGKLETAMRIFSVSEFFTYTHYIHFEIAEITRNKNVK